MTQRFAHYGTWAFIIGILLFGAGVYFWFQTKAGVTVSSDDPSFQGATVGSDDPSFQADLKNTLSLQRGIGGPTFTRATVATVTDFEGLIKNVKSGEARFEGARRVENLMTNSEIFGSWTASNVTVATNSVASPAGTVTAETLTASSGNGTVTQSYTATANTYAFSVYLKRLTGSGTIQISYDGTTYTTVTLTNSWQRFSVNGTVSAGAITPGIKIVTSTDAVYAWGGQLELISGQANQYPSEYVSVGVLSSAPYHGANVDGVKYFTTQNGNMVASNVVTEATGVAIPDATLHGYVAEGARTNLLRYSEQFDNGAWTKSNVLAFGSGSVVDAIASPAGTVTAEKVTEGTGNKLYGMYQAGLSLTGTHSLSFYAKQNGRRYILVYINNATSGHYVTANFDLVSGTVANTYVGSGGGASLVGTSITLSANGFYRCTLTASLDSITYAGVFFSDVSNPTINGNGTTSYTGDGASGVYLWGAQLEAGAFATSYIPTVASTVTRNSDVLTYPTSGNVSGTKGSAFADICTEWTAQNNKGSQILSIGTSRPALFFDSTNGKLSLNDGTADRIGDVFTGSASSQKIASVWSGSASKTFIAGTASSALGFDGDMNIETMSVGSDSSSANQLFGTIRNVKIWKKALSDGQLTDMTSTTEAVSNSAVRKTIVNASQNTKLTNGLVGLWSFNGPDMSGTTAYDRSGNNNNGTLTNGPTLTSGKVGQGLRFDGSDDSVNLGSPTALNDLGPVTYSAWIYPRTQGENNGGTIFAKGNSTGSSGYIFFRFYSGTSDYSMSFLKDYSTTDLLRVTNANAIKQNTWQHLVVTWDGGATATGVHIFIDGIESSYQTTQNGVDTKNSDASLSSFIGNRGFLDTTWDGTLDEVRIYNRALSPSEVTQLYNMGK